MKRSKTLIFAAAAVITLILVVLGLRACESGYMRKYYSQKENYVTAIGTVTYVSYNDNKTALYLGFSDLSYRFDDTCFKIVGDNLSAVQKKGIDEKVKVGTTIEFITAPKYFGDGYVMPIVSVKMDGEELLTFDDGFDNLQEYLK